MFRKLSSFGKDGYWLAFLAVLSVLPLSCSGPAQKDPERDFQSVVEEVAQNTPHYSRMEPLGVPDRVLEAANSGNEAAQRLVSWTRILNESLQVRRNPSPPALSSLSLKISEDARKPTPASEIAPLRTKECVSLPYPICTFTWYENNGRLKVVARQMDLPTDWYLGIFFEGEEGGYRYQDEPIQVWQTRKDLEWAVYSYFSKMPLCSSTTLLQWQNLRWVEGEGQLCIGYFGCWDLYETHWVSKTYHCNGLGEYHPVWQLESVSYPRISSISSEWRSHRWSHGKKQLFLWSELIYFRDYRYCETLFNEDGRVIKRECGIW